MSNRFEIEPLKPGLTFGAVVTGLTLAHLEDAKVRKQIFDLWIDKGVVVFRGASSPELQIEISKCCGKLADFPFKESTAEGHPELVKIKYNPDDGSCYEVNGVKIGGWIPWHSDLIYTDSINHGGVLRPVQLPKRGGKTGFIDKIDVYNRLPKDLQETIENLHVVYTMDLNYGNMKYARPEQIRFVQGAKSFMKIVQRCYQYPRVTHPMVFTQAETGRKVLNVSPGFADGIYEMGGPEGEALLAEVVKYCVDDSGAYYHEWRQDDMVLWDNWRMLHCALGVPPEEARVMLRTTIAGDYGFGRKLDASGAGLPVIEV